VKYFSNLQKRSKQSLPSCRGIIRYNVICHPDSDSVLTSSVLVSVKLVKESFVANVACRPLLRSVHQPMVSQTNVLIFELTAACHAHKQAIGRLDN